MLVSELRGSLTGLDRAVKTYSFMLSEDQVPSIQVQGPSSSSSTTAATSGAASSLVPAVESSSTLQKMSSAFSSFESEEEENEEEDENYPSGSMDNFATGILDAFESNLLKLKDYTTRSLPDVFKESTSKYHHPGGEEEEEEDNSCEVSPLSSASASTTSIADSIEQTADASFSSTSSARPLHHHHYHHHHPRSYAHQPPNLSRPHHHQHQNQHHHPLADQLSYDLASPRSGNDEVNKSTESAGDGARVEKHLIPVMAGDEEKKPSSYYSRVNGTGGEGGRHSRMFSGDSLGACSLAGSEYSEKDFSGFSSSSPGPSGLTSTVSSRFPRLHNGTGSISGDQGPQNGRESAAGGDVSPLDEITKRISKTSITSTSDMYK